MRTLSIVLVIAVTLAQAAAQTVRLAVGTSFAPAAQPSIGVELRELRSSDTTSTLRLEVGSAAMVGLDLRRTDTFGPLGNVIFEVGGRLRTDAAYEGRFGVRGVIGPLALALAVSAFNAAPATFSAGDAARDTRPVTARGQVGFGLDIDAEFRADRGLVIGLAPDLYLVDGRIAARLLAEARLLRLFPEVDGALALHGYASPGFEPAFAALGVGAVWRRRRAPTWSGTVWLGLGSSLAPGLSARLAEPLGGGALVTIDLAAQPYRRDVAPYRFAATLTLPAGSGTVDIGGAFAYDDGTSTTISVGYGLPLDR